LTGVLTQSETKDPRLKPENLNRRFVATLALFSRSNEAARLSNPKILTQRSRRNAD
jgi:hypothetical protein